MDPGGHRPWLPPQPPVQGSAHGSSSENIQQPQMNGQPFGTRPTSPSHGRSGLHPSQSSGPYHHYNSAPSLANLAGISQSSPRQPHLQAVRPEGPGLPLPGFSQATGQPGSAERDRERAREAEHMHREAAYAHREAEQMHIKEDEDRRHREQQDRQRLEQSAHPAASMPLHQPVAVGPRTVHGPNGLLGNPGISGPPPQPQMPLGGPGGPGSLFNGGPVQSTAPTQSHSQQQQMQANMLMPYANSGQAQGPQQQQSQQAQSQGQQPILNDALSYLDQVKVQFADQPDVYNRFLDIMKDFKSGAIDTPGVIGRVSSLFAGNPDLIQGFNTFLPPGYRIECGMDSDPNSIRVTTPMGQTVHSIPTGRPLSRLGDETHDGRISNGTFTPKPAQQRAHMAFSPSGRQIGGGSAPYQSQHLSPEQNAIHQQQERGVNYLQNAVSAATSGGMRAGVSPRTTPAPGQQETSTDIQQAMAEKKGPVEFNHAISYVNKIKNRFAAHPDIYKQFLEILQTYQRESKPIQEVYSEVTHLFKTAPDLLEDFKQFLPESAAHAKAAERARQQAEESSLLTSVRNDTAGMYASPIISRETQMGTPNQARGNLPPVGNFAPTPVGKDNKRKRSERQATVGSLTEQAGGANTGKGNNHAAPAKRGKHTHTAADVKAQFDPMPPSPSLVPALPAPIAPTNTSAATHEELAFFDRAKKAIGNKIAMNEFLKLCNLFSQDLIDRTTLIQRARNFIGLNPDLMKWFEDFVGPDKQMEQDRSLIKNTERARVPRGRIALDNCRSLKGSYRLLPKREEQKECSGRDELCNTILNDEWASHPTWASEDSGFIAHRKNAHEDTLHRIEEERHDYDFNIEACARTIQLLGPIAGQLRDMTERDQAGFQLPKGLGGQSDAIYKRVIMKLYGREKGRHVIEQLHQSPYHVVPVLLNRLKERLVTWKMGQREWEKVWRDQTQRMFWKSLDHQAENTKNKDRRQFQTKALQIEVQGKYEQMRQNENLNPGSMRGMPQLEMIVDDLDVVVDTTYLLLAFVETQCSTETPRLAPFVKEYIKTFFGADAEQFESKLRARAKTALSPRDTEDMDTGSEETNGEKRGRKLGKSSLLRRTLDKGRNKATGNQSEPASRASTPDVSSTAGENEVTDVDMAEALTADDTEPVSTTPVEAEPSEKWLNHPVITNAVGGKTLDPNEPHARSVFRMWTNTPTYCFVRMFLFLYERLVRLKAGERECRDIVRSAQTQKPAVQLGMVDKLPEDFFSDTSPTANYYTQMLSKFAQVLQGDIDFQTNGIEDCLRRFYIQAGYPLYPLEKMVQGMARFGSQVVNQDSANKEKSWDIYQLFLKDRRKEELSPVQATDYRKAVEKMIGPGGEGYGIDWDENKKAVRVYLWKKDDPYFTGETFSDRDRENRWRYYIASYSSTDDTVGIDKSQLSQVVLSRNIAALGTDSESDRQNTHADEAENTSRASRIYGRFLVNKNDEQLVMRIAMENYHRVFQPGTSEGFLAQLPAREGGEQGVTNAAECAVERRKAMEERFVARNNVVQAMSSEQIEKSNKSFAELLAGLSCEVDGEAMDID